MTMQRSMVCLASRTLGISIRRLSTGARCWNEVGLLGVASTEAFHHRVHRFDLGCNTNCPPMNNIDFYYLRLNGKYHRYFSGKNGGKSSEGENSTTSEENEIEISGDEFTKTTSDHNEFDPSKFTHEVKVRMPDIGDDGGGEQ